MAEDVGELLLLAVRYHNSGNDSGDDDKQEHEKTETDPSFLAGSSSGHYRVIRVLDPGDGVNDGERRRSQYDVPLRCVLFDVMGCVLDVVYRLILLVDQNAHLKSSVSRETQGVTS